MKNRLAAGAIAVATLALGPRASSAQVLAGPEFQVNSYTTGIQDQVAVAVEPDGDYLVVWESTGQDGNSDAAVAQRFNRDGSPRGAEFIVNTYTIGAQNSVEAAVNKRGRAVVVWESTGQDGNLDGIYGQLYDASGAAAGGEFRVNSYTTGSQLFPSAGMDGRGNFVVVWESPNVDGNLAAVVAQRYDRAGNPVGANFQVNAYTTGAQDTAKVAMASDGKFVVVWESFDGNSDGVFAQRYESTGNPVGGEFLVNTTTAGIQDDPVVGIAEDGSFAVVWEGATELNGQKFDAAGNRVGGEFLVNTYTTNTQFVYGMAMDDQGNFIVAWEELSGRDGNASGVFGQRFDTAAAYRGPEFRANTYTNSSQGWPSLSADEAGNYVVVWQSTLQDAGTTGIFGQRFGGIYTNALAVDTAANGVIEPGETVDVRPVWRNHSGAPQAITGALSGLTGPAGPTYTITDAAADHGTIADGADSNCGANCYGVSISNPPSRPAQHWDASALESLAPDAQGQQKRWTLHVGASFTDVPPSSGFYRFVETMLHYQITGGCTVMTYCPQAATTRAQMAVFVLLAKEEVSFAPPACTTPMFNDVPASSPFCRWIEELARRGVVAGCGNGNYCPDAPVTREQMAVFVLRVVDPTANPPACVPPNRFNDVPETSPFCRWIEELANRGVVSGCGGGNYCPADPVTREQMAVFVSVTFGLTLYGP